MGESERSAFTAIHRSGRTRLRKCMSMTIWTSISSAVMSRRHRPTGSYDEIECLPKEVDYRHLTAVGGQLHPMTPPRVRGCVSVR